MRARLIWIWTGLCAAVCSFGCAINVQNRYSVFGFDRYLTDSIEQARTYSFVLLGITAVISMALGAVGTHLFQRMRRKWREAAGERREFAPTASQAPSNAGMDSRELEESRTN